MSGSLWGVRVGGIFLCSLPKPLLSHTPNPPAEMDFAKGLQKIVPNCRQSITQEVGRAACVFEGTGRGPG